MSKYKNIGILTNEMTPVELTLIVATSINLLTMPLIAAAVAGVRLSRRCRSAASLIGACVAVFLAAWVLQWGVFLNANTYPLDQDNKLAVLSRLPPEFLAGRMAPLRGEGDVRPIADVFRFPVVVKPTRCAKLGLGIVVHDDRASFMRFFATEEGVRVARSGEFFVQEYAAGEVELGILVEKMPGGANSLHRVVSVVEKSPASGRVRPSCVSGHRCRERRDLAVSPSLIASARRIASSIPGFNVGRYDVRTTERDVAQGRFAVVEVNGAMGFDLATMTGSANQCFWLSERWFLARMLVGAANIATFRGYSPAALAAVMGIAVRNAWQCGDWEKLFALYS